MTIPERQTESAGRQTRPASGLRRFGGPLLAVLSALVTYLLAEGLASHLYRIGFLDPLVLRVYEQTDPAGNIRRDRARGYTLSPVPARFSMHAIGGRLLSNGMLRGNSSGFSDRQDFTTRPSVPGERRFAVLGDSMTAGRFIMVNWPERVQDQLNHRDRPPVRLYNMAIDGGGLGNWASIVRRFIVPSGIELNGIIVAVSSDDLDRPFVWWDDSLQRFPPYRTLVVNYDTTWSQEIDPFDVVVEETTDSNNWIVVPPDRYDALLSGNLELPAPKRPFRPYFASRLKRLWDGFGLPEAEASTPPPDSEQERRLRRELIDGMRRHIERLRLRVLVLAIPGTDVGRARAFAAHLGADYIDGPEVPERLNIEIDGHLSQEGSDFFATAVAGRLAAWIDAAP